MSEPLVKTRFAPSPTGDLHLGNVRTALFSYLLARHHGGSLLLRVEDTDATRSSAEAERNLLQDLRWLSLQWDEGPEVDGDSGPYHQSARQAIYEHHFADLERQGLSYPCFCTPTELEIARKVQLASGRPPRYAGTCAQLTEDQTAAKRQQGLTASTRFRVPDGEMIEFVDLVRGPQRFASNDIGDFVIRRADGSAAFFFCNALDDALMGVTHVLRGEDHLSNTPRQLLLLQALGLRCPGYGHVSLIVGEDGKPLAKRLGSLSVKNLRERGYLPSAINNALARLGHHYEHTGFMDLPQLSDSFGTSHLGHAPARFEIKQLDHWQQEAIRHEPDDALWAWLPGDVRETISTARKPVFLKLVRENVRLPEEARDWAQILFTDSFACSEQATAALHTASPVFFTEALRAHTENPGDFRQFSETLKAKTGLSGKSLFQPLRAALTGRLDGPDLASLYTMIDFDRLQQRLQKHLQK